MAHPLCGADLATLAALFRAGGRPARGRLGIAAAIWAAAIGRAPATFIERRLTARRIARIEMPPPLVVIGHWRSGTTHLANLLAATGRFGVATPIAVGMPWDMLGLARLLRPLLVRALPEGRYIDKVAVTPDAPQEDEIALASMAPASFYHGIYFPSRFGEALRGGLFFEGVTDDERRRRLDAIATFNRKVFLDQGRPVLIKNPVYTACPATLRALFPGAKFVHIHRNPYDVAVSMRNFHARLLEALALQRFDHVDIDEAIFSVYREMMRRFEVETVGWAPPELVETGYDALNADPVGTLRQIFDGLGLGDFGEAEPRVRAYLDSIASYRPNRFREDPALAARVARELGPWLDKWGYRIPVAAA